MPIQTDIIDTVENLFASMPTWLIYSCLFLFLVGFAALLLKNRNKSKNESQPSSNSSQPPNEKVSDESEDDTFEEDVSEEETLEVSSTTPDNEDDSDDIDSTEYCDGELLEIRNAFCELAKTLLHIYEQRLSYLPNPEAFAKEQAWCAETLIHIFSESTILFEEYAYDEHDEDDNEDISTEMLIMQMRGNCKQLKEICEEIIQKLEKLINQSKEHSVLFGDMVRLEQGIIKKLKAALKIVVTEATEFYPKVFHTHLKREIVTDDND